MEWGLRHAPAALYPRRKTPGTYCTGGWVGPRARLDTEARGKILSPLPGIERRSPVRPARNQTLHWLSYPHVPAVLRLWHSLLASEYFECGLRKRTLLYHTTCRKNPSSCVKSTFLPSSHIICSSTLTQIHEAKFEGFFYFCLLQLFRTIHSRKYQGRQPMYSERTIEAWIIHCITHILL
jgi:hypothetical protein